MKNIDDDETDIYYRNQVHFIFSKDKNKIKSQQEWIVDQLITFLIDSA